MNEYLSFVWESFIHPHSILDLLAPIQLFLAFICFYYIIRSFIEIYKLRKK